MQGGDRVQVQRGEATVMGVYRGHLWYKVDSDDGAWYWSGTEFVDAMNMGMAAPLPTPPAVLTERALDARGASDVFKMPLEVFLEHVRDARWTLAADEALVRLANVQCDDDGVSPRQLRVRPPGAHAAALYPEFFSAAGSLPLLRARYARAPVCLLHVWRPLGICISPCAPIGHMRIPLRAPIGHMRIPIRPLDKCDPRARAH